MLQHFRFIFIQLKLVKNQVITFNNLRCCKPDRNSCLLCMILKRNILPVCLALLAAHLNLIDRKAQMEHPVGKAGNDAEIENKIGHTERTLAGQIRKVNIGDGLAHGAEQSGNAVKCYAGVGVPGIDFFNPAKGGGNRLPL